MELLTHHLTTILRLLCFASVLVLALATLDNFWPGLFPTSWQRLKALAIILKRRAVSLANRHGGATIVIIGLVGWFAYKPIADVVSGEGSDGAALMDIGVFQTILLAVIRAVALYCFARVLIKKYMAVVGKFLYGKAFIRAFYSLSEWQKIICSLWVLSLFVFLVTQLTR